MEQYGHKVAQLNRKMASVGETNKPKTVDWADEMRQGLQKRVDDRVCALFRVDKEIRDCRSRILEREQQGKPKCTELAFLKSELGSRHNALVREIAGMNKMLDSE